MKLKPILGMLTLFAVNLSSCSTQDMPGQDAEKAEIARVIETSITWALTKDREALLNSVAHDASFFIFHPDSASTIVGYDSFQKLVDDFFMHEDFKATGSEIKDLRVNLSRSGDVAWYSALLDDFGEWKGKPTSWVNARWTGVLEKREGRWVIVQMHFSFAK